MKIEVVETPDRLAALREEWSALWDRCPDATPFQTPEWGLSWWQHLGRGRLHTLAFRHGSRLVGLAPLSVSAYYGLPLRRLAWIGTGNTDYLDLLAEPELRAAVLSLFWEKGEEYRGWDFCDFQQLRPGSALLPGIDLKRRRRWEQEVCPELPLPRSAEEFYRQLSRRLRSNVRYYRGRLEREGAAVEEATAATRPELLEALFRLHGERWRKRGLPGVFNSRRVREFHAAVSAGMLSRGRLRLYGLRLRGEIRAALYCFSDGRRGYYYAGGFDSELARFSPGTVLIAHAIEAAIAEGCKYFDFLRGNEAYKYSWGAQDCPNSRLICWRAGLTGALVPHLVRLETSAEILVKRAADRLIRAR